ncbi:DUF1731 domain-containing protein [Paeniglutamicibacter kerguelensis]|uniref:Uncharacterized protein (TIGR01777 family) n=1 Tax=Paeniglutamicibacter kerguelensis TaxID=254788 RepID=A0ABS4XG58_9MICC|nr:DUF1731 domain-containing protein [Paeniglutamicibacter kerguelensis]MBP2387463.1 uncharacterized protein (TIGR01777 family) [Paeniglutamicibacter kerguelensis]
MAWQRTQTQFFALPVSALWEVLKDPARVPEWNPAIARLDPRTQPATAGTEIDLVPTGDVIGPIHAKTAAPAVITRIDEGSSLTWRQPQPGGYLLVRWSLSEVSGGCELTQLVSVSGLASPLFAQTAAKPIAGNFAQNCARLYTLAGGTETRDLRVVIAGGHGFLGSRAAADLHCRGHQVTVLTRTVRKDSPYRQLPWDGKTQGPWAGALYAQGRPTAVLNLAGELVDLPPTPENIKRLRSSRVDSTRALVEASSALPRPLAAFLQSSTTAIFADAGEQRLTESSALPTGTRALPQMTGVARPWEEAVAGANAERVNILRTSLVFEQESPLVDRLSLLAQAGLGGPVAGGRQWVSWIHLADWLRIVRACLGLGEDPALPEGVINLAAPNPVRNTEMMSLLRARVAPGVLKKFGLPTPKPVLAAGAVLLHTDPALGTTGRYVTSEVLEAAGFEFEHPTFAGALRGIFG